jgi:hypothetical protein
MTALGGTGWIGSCCCSPFEPNATEELPLLLLTGGALNVACNIDEVTILLLAFSVAPAVALGSMV